jgi:hypothetical protein
MPERRPRESPDRTRPATLRRADVDAGGGAGARRPAERHYLAVVAAEARRLGRQLRPPLPRTPIGPEGSH